MSNRNQRRKRHPFVRFIRSVLRLIRAILKPKKRLSRSLDRHGSRSSSFELLPPDFQQVAPDVPSETTAISIATPLAISTQASSFETIGELFDRVQWQMLPTPIVVKVAAPPQIVRTNLASPSGLSLETVGELFERVKWQISTPTIQAKVASTGRVVRTHDVSLN
ncbi:hypothetical protein [Chamaesiphon sp.]|uniref:hypothetical protein n=1 Tax=Chamaesiphon sp. TaxID=2814140 RepID=UPI0035939AB0